MTDVIIISASSEGNEHTSKVKIDMYRMAGNFGGGFHWCFGRFVEECEMYKLTIF